MEKITLFFLEKPDVKITMQIYFNEKNNCFLMGMTQVP